MFLHYEPILKLLNEMPEGLESEDFRDKLLTLPVELWGHMLWGTHHIAKYPRLCSFAPKLPSVEVQSRFVGGSGEKMLPRNADFMRMFEAGVSTALNRPLRNLRILDYGCGWGRLTRYFLRYCAPGDLVAADPDKPMVDELIREHFPAEVKNIPYLPETLDVGEDFDVVNLYSVFTHLPDWLLASIMKLLLRVVKPNSVVVFTVRAPEFWPYYSNATKDPRFDNCEQEHKENGYVFVPLMGKNGQESRNYGDASYSVERLLDLLDGWRVVKTDLTSNDPFQIIYFVRPE